MENLKRDAYVLYLAYRDPRTPRLAKLLTAAALGYALCPIDLIPDFIPVLGLIDDLVIVPAGMAIALRSVPVQVIEDLRKRSAVDPPSTRARWIMALAVILVWVLGAVIVAGLVLKILGGA